MSASLAHPLTGTYVPAVACFPRFPSSGCISAPFLAVA